MSKKSPKRDDSYFAAGRRKQKKMMMIIIPVIAAVVVIAGVSAAMYYATTPQYAPFGSAHDHAAFFVRINGENIDFGQGKYQVQSRIIHVENSEGRILHKHSTDVPVGEFFRSVDMGIEDNCFVTDDGMRHCEDDQNQLRYFINENEAESISDYVLQQGDRLLVVYGNETQEQINQVLAQLDRIDIDALS